MFKAFILYKIKAFFLRIRFDRNDEAVKTEAARIEISNIKKRGDKSGVFNLLQSVWERPNRQRES